MSNFSDKQFINLDINALILQMKKELTDAVIREKKSFTWETRF
jgi:hypothetical protein